jgi:hypothetical protein
MATEILTCWAIRILAKGQQVYYKNLGDSYHSAVWWLRENIPEVEAVLEQHIDDQPQVLLEDVFVSEDH